MILTENKALEILMLFENFTFDKGMIEATEVEEIFDTLYFDESTRKDRDSHSIVEGLEYKTKLYRFARELYLLEKVRRTKTGTTYKSVMTFKKDMPQEVKQELFEMIEEKFDNYTGKISGNWIDDNTLVYEADEENFVCLHYSNSEVYEEIELFRKWIDSWKYIDPDPEECSDLKKSYLIIFKKRRGIDLAFE